MERRDSMISEHDRLRLSNRPVRAARQAVESEIEALLAQRRRLRTDRPKWLDVTLSARLEKLLAITTAAPLTVMRSVRCSARYSARWSLTGRATGWSSIGNMAGKVLCE